jgi:hypothetical protein
MSGRRRLYDHTGDHDIWAAAYALATAVKLVQVLPGEWSRYVFDDSFGKASRALGEWRTDRAYVSARALATAYRQLKRTSYNQQPSHGTVKGQQKVGASITQ